MEEPHDEVSITDTCISFELLVDGSYLGKGKVSLPMQWKILPWISTMRPCIKRQWPLTAAKLVEVVYEFIVEGVNAHDKGGMWWLLWKNGSCFSHMDKLAKFPSWLMDRLEKGTHLSLMILGWTSHGQNQEKVLVEHLVEELWWKRLMWHDDMVWVTMGTRLDCRLGWGWLIVVMGLLNWTTWTTWVMDIKLETWSMVVLCRNIMQEHL